MKLSEVKPGGRCMVGDCEGLPCRLLEMGILPGSILEVTRLAPMGDPICLRHQRCVLAIRVEDASQIEVSAL